MGWHSRCCGSQRRRKPRQRHSSPLLESSCPKPSPAGQARPATSIHTFAPKVRPFFSRPPPQRGSRLSCACGSKNISRSSGQAISLRKPRRIWAHLWQLMHPGAARHSTRASLGLVGSTGPLLHSRRECKTHTKAGFPTRAAERREMLWAQRVHGSARRLSCTLEWSERSTRD